MLLTLPGGNQLHVVALRDMSCRLRSRRSLAPPSRRYRRSDARICLPDGRAVDLDDRDPELDPGTLLVFLGGHCHSLALAVQKRIGWPLVAVDHRRGGTRAHVAVRDGAEIVDIGGRHTVDELDAAVDGGVEVVDVSVSEIDQLVAKGGRSAARPGLAMPWVPLVLDPSVSSPTLR